MLVMGVTNGAWSALTGLVALNIIYSTSTPSSHPGYAELPILLSRLYLMFLLKPNSRKKEFNLYDARIDKLFELEILCRAVYYTPPWSM